MSDHDTKLHVATDSAHLDPKMAKTNRPNARDPTPEPTDGHESLDERRTADLPPPTVTDTARPTHRVLDMKTGDHGVQLLVSTKDHLYDAKTVHGGIGAWQCIGSWEDPTIQKVATLLSQREGTGARNTADQKSADQRHGKGHRLGESANMGSHARTAE